MLTAIALLAAPTLPAQSIERRIEFVAEDMATATVQAAIGSNFNSPGIASSAVASFDIPSGDRVTHLSADVSTYIEAQITLDVTALDAGGTRFGGSYTDSAFACEADACTWGIFDSFSQSSPLANFFDVVPQGESRTFTEGLSACGTICDQSALFTPAGFSWTELQASPSFESFAPLKFQ